MPPEEPSPVPETPTPPSEPVAEPAIVSNVEPPTVESQTPETQEPLPEPTPVPEPAPAPPEPPKEPLPQEQPKEPEPVPEPTPAEPPAPTPTPEPEPTPETTSPIKDEPKAEPQIEPITTPAVVVLAPPTPPIAPAKHDPKYTKGVPQRVLELTTEEIDAARKLWAREHIAEAQAQGNRNRRARMNSRMNEIEKLIKTEHLSTTHAIALRMQLSEKTTSGYVQKLVKANRITGTGNSSNRRYSG